MRWYPWDAQKHTHELRSHGAEKKYIFLWLRCAWPVYGGNNLWGWSLKKKKTGSQSRDTFLVGMRRAHHRLSSGARCAVAQSGRCSNGLARHEWVLGFGYLHLLNWEPVGRICLNVRPFTNSHEDSILCCDLVFLAQQKSLLWFYSSSLAMMILHVPEEWRISAIELSIGGLNKTLYYWFLSTKLTRGIAGVYLIELPKNI